MHYVKPGSQMNLWREGGRRGQRERNETAQHVGIYWDGSYTGGSSEMLSLAGTKS